VEPSGKASAVDFDEPLESGGPSEDAGPPPSTSVDSLLRDVAHYSEPSGPVPSRSAGTMVADRFRLERRLGEGGMGVVWEATHTVTRKPVALKFLKRSHEDGRAVQRFLREARAASAVRHPSVVEVHDVLELDDGSPVMVMELLHGETLAERLRRRGALPLSEVASIMVHVCSALGAAHALGIVHRDLKPENIFLESAPEAPDRRERREVKVLDFGIAKLTATEGDAAHTGATTGTGAVLGSPYYMAPEQLFAEKDLDHRADIWALGVILYEALSGVRPTQAPNLGQIYKMVMTDAIVPLREKAPELPPAVTDLVGRMLTRDRAGRPRDVREVLSVLSEHTKEAFPVVLAPASRSSSVDAVVTSSERRRGRSWMALPIVAAGGALVFFLGRGSPSTRPAVAVESVPSPATAAVVPSPAETPKTESAPSNATAAAIAASSQASSTPSGSAEPPTVREAPRPVRPIASTGARVTPLPSAPAPSARRPTDPASYQ
jgi:eukaryotic-like serine/threonine-protein kinase